MSTTMASAKWRVGPNRKGRCDDRANKDELDCKKTSNQSCGFALLASCADCRAGPKESTGDLEQKFEKVSMRDGEVGDRGKAPQMRAWGRELQQLTNEAASRLISGSER